MTTGSFIAAFITGHSLPGCTGLSHEQQDFQQRSGIGTAQWLHHNFPWTETHPFPQHFSLISASFHNVSHYLASRRPAFALAHREAAVALLGQYETILLLAGSCGLELFNNLHLPEALRRRIHIFAYGPVSRQLPAVASHFLVQGTHDWLSRFYHPQVQHRYPCAHMEYLQAPETLQLFNDYHRKVTTA
jgi:hypothetical protein